MLPVLCLLLILFTLTNSQQDVIPKSNDFCRLPFDIGTCSRIGWVGLERFYFSAKSRKCERFTYSGCGGNANRFYEELVCERVCGFYFRKRSITDEAAELEVIAAENEALLATFSIEEMSKRLCHRGLPFDIPTSPQNAVQCGARRPCPNDYDCIFGPKNYYQRLAICCPKRPHTTTVSKVGNGGDYDEHLLTGVTMMRPEWCLLPPVPGPCRQVTLEWYYDVARGICRSFTYGGCKGNQNRFRTQEQCERTCPPLVVQLGTTPIPSTVRIPTTNVPSRCLLPVDSGPGSTYSIKYYFEPALSTCLPFMFGKCGGNANRFENELSCTVVCRPEIANEVRDEARRKGVALFVNDIAETLSCDSDNGNSSTFLVITKRPNLDVSYFHHPTNGYATCSEPTKCLINPCLIARCPAYANAICKPNACSGCLAEFYLNEKRVNCTTNSATGGLILTKPGSCRSITTDDCPSNSSKPQNILCSTDAECFADQKCCHDACYSSSPQFKTCQTPIRRHY